MGYYINLEDSKFHVKKENVRPLMGALYRWMASGGKYGRSWINSKVIQDKYEKNDIGGMFNECRWPIRVDADGNIVEIRFEGEKLGDDESMFSAISEFIEDKSYIQILGEEGEAWRWYFIGGKLYEDHVNRVWKSDQELGL